MLAYALTVIIDVQPSMNQLLDTCSRIKYHPHEFRGRSRIGRIKISLVTRDLIGSFKLRADEQA